MGGAESVLSNRGLRIKTKKCLCEGVIVPTGYKKYLEKERECSRQEVFAKLVGVSRMDRVRNEEVRNRDGMEINLSSIADQRVLRRFGHVERMAEFRMAKRVFMTDISGGLEGDRPRLDWMDGVKVALSHLHGLEQTEE